MATYAAAQVDDRVSGLDSGLPTVCVGWPAAPSWRDKVRRKVKENVEPAPDVLVTEIEPPRSRANSLEMLNPRPTPL